MVNYAIVLLVCASWCELAFVVPVMVITIFGFAAFVCEMELVRC